MSRKFRQRLEIEQRNTCKNTMEYKIIITISISRAWFEDSSTFLDLIYQFTGRDFFIRQGCTVNESYFHHNETVGRVEAGPEKL